MLVSALIAQICAGMSGAQLEACSKAVTAAGLQTGATQQIELVEKKTTEIVVKQVTSVTGETVWVITGTAYKAARDRSITYPIIRNPKGIIPSVVPTIGTNSGIINFGWRF